MCGAVVLARAQGADVLPGCYHQKAPAVRPASPVHRLHGVSTRDQAKVKSAPDERPPSATAPHAAASTTAGARPTWAWIALAAVPIVGGLLRLSLFGAASLNSAAAHSTEVAVAEAAATLGCFVAATSFEWRDHLARAWALQGFMYVLLVVRCAGLAFGVITGSPSAVLADGVLTSFANIGGIFSTWMLARTGHIAGIHEVISPNLRRGAWVVALLVAVTASGPGLLIAARNLANGNEGALVSVASRTGDIFSFVLIAPLLLTTLALRQGLLVWPWALLTASALCWLGADFTNAAFLHLPNDQVGPLFDLFRFPACLFVLAAGIAQRWVIDARELESAVVIRS
jgi:hypothetical protein